MSAELKKRIFQITSNRNLIAPPYFMEISLSRECNLNCRMCGRKNVKAELRTIRAELSKEKLVRVMKEAAILGVREVHIGCQIGEPMCEAERTLGVMEAIKKYGMKGNIVTNGTLFNEEIVKRVVEIKWDEIMFSVYSDSAQIHDFITTRKGSFQACIENIESFIQEKKKRRRARPAISIAFVPTNKNYFKINEMIKWGHRIGINNIIIEPLVIYHKSGKELELSQRQREEFQNFLATGSILAEKHGIFTNFKDIELSVIEHSSEMVKVVTSEIQKFSEHSPLSIYCFAPWLKICISEDGKVNPCPPLWLEGGENIRRKSLRKIWNGKYFENYRKRIKKRELPDACKKCAAQVVIDMSREVRRELQRQLDEC